MRYALLVYTNPSVQEGLSEDEFMGARREYLALREDPRFLAGDQLHPIETATTVRVEDGQTLTTDGPFADTKEVFGGYYIFEAGDLDEVIELAARVPAARHGGKVEVRPIVELQ